MTQNGIPVSVERLENDPWLQEEEVQPVLKYSSELQVGPSIFYRKKIEKPLAAITNSLLAKSREKPPSISLQKLDEYKSH